MGSAALLHAQAVMSPSGTPVDTSQVQAKAAGVVTAFSHWQT